ncbi:MAG: hypothetical protein ACREHF_10945 [Rhizomicrobium sp.]
MNVRLFYALDAMERVTGTAVTTINWPVDDRCEVRRDKAKDDDIREYMATFMAAYKSGSKDALSVQILASDVHKRLVRERDEFVRTKIRRREDYDGPPNSVEFLSLENFKRRHHFEVNPFAHGVTEIVLYNVGMQYIRSDPYTGMAMLYHYLYVAEHKHRRLVLWFPNITHTMWRHAARRPNRKDIRMFRVAADAIAFRDALVKRGDL